MEEQGITQIYALPLFIASSSMFDIPTILGLYYNKKIVAKLKEEGAKIVGTKAKITIGPTLDYQSVLKDIMLERVKELSQDPKNEALVVLAHGDEQFSMFWNRLIHQTVNYILGQTGIEFAQKAYVEMGQSFAFNAIPVIKKAASKKNRVIVVGMYLSSGVKNMPDKTGVIIGGELMQSNIMLKGLNIVYSDKGLLQGSKITEWIVDRATEWAKK